MTNHVVSEGQGTAHSFLRDNSSDVQIGDTIEYVSNNQMGYEKYQVICREKGLKLIDDYDSQMNPVYSDESVGSRSRSRSNSASRKKRARSSSRSRSRSSSRSRGGKRNKRKTQRK